MEEASLLFQWAEGNHLSLKAEHSAAVSNITADWLSKKRLSDSEWQEHQEIFWKLTKRWGILLIDLFASNENAMLPRFLTRLPIVGPEGTDALQHQWPTGLLYAFPQFSPYSCF